jgi:hypothetical protein
MAITEYPPCSLGLSATRQEYFCLTSNQPLATSQQYYSLRTNQHQPPANRTGCSSWKFRTPYFSELVISEHQKISIIKTTYWISTY